MEPNQNQISKWPNVLGAKYQQIFQIGQHETMSHGQKRVAEFMTRAMLRYWLWAVAFLSRNCYLGTCLDIDTLTTVFENHRTTLRVKQATLHSKLAIF